MTLHVRYDNRIRLTASALLLTRFRHEQSKYKWHPIKQRVLSHVLPLTNHPFSILLNKLAERWFMNSFYSIALLLEQVEPGFRIPEALGQQIPELHSARYVELLWKFQQDAELEGLWHKTADLWDQTVNDCQGLLHGGRVEEFLDLVYGPTSARFFVVPNPIDPACFGFGIPTPEDYFSIVAPPVVALSDHREAQYLKWGSTLGEMVVHELSHSLLGAARSKFPALIEGTKHLAGRISPRGYFAKMYDNWEIQLDEMLIRAVEALYLSETKGASAAESKLAKEDSEYGISLIWPIFESLYRYLQGRRRGEYSRLSDFLPELADQMVKW